MAIDEFDHDDECFTKPGAVPFKWEIRPGVPKIQAQQHKQPYNNTHHLNLKLKPPPSGSLLFLPPPEPRTRSFRSPSRTRSERWRFDQQPSMLARRPEIVSSVGCFLSPLLRRRKTSKRGSRSSVPGPAKSEPDDYSSDLETLARWSLSSRKTLLSPFCGGNSPTPTSLSSFSSYQSSPRPVCDAEWAGFGLF